MTTEILFLGEGRRMASPGFSVQSFVLHERGLASSPILNFDDFRVGERAFGPHPHAGFSAVTYLFEDSEGAARSRDSLGNDIVVGPGGIVWTQAGRGVMHHELPADPARSLHGAQIFVNLSAARKTIVPSVMWLDGKDVPRWQNGRGDQIRVVVGRYGEVASALVPAEPFTLLDVALRKGVDMPLMAGQFGLFYAQSGEVGLRADGGDAVVELQAGEAAAVRGGGILQLQGRPGGRVLVLAAKEIHEPVVARGPFIMNNADQIVAAVRRFEAGEMGRLASPVPLQADVPPLIL